MTTIEARLGERGTGTLLALMAALMWGSQFPVAKSLYRTLDPYTLTAVRYGIATLGFAALLALVEGRCTLSFDGHLLRATGLGILGIGGGVLLVYVGLQHTQATSASLVLATQPLLMALVLRLRAGVHLSGATLAAMGAAILGVLLVITHGAPSTLWNGGVGWGIVLVLAGQVGFVAYTIEAGSFGGWSPLRYTALTAVPATLLVLALLAVADAAGWAHPSEHAVSASPWLLLYAIVGPALIAVLAWNTGRVRLGAQNIALFQNLVPITTFAITIAQGYRPGAVESLGALVTLAALVTHNVLQRRRVAYA